MSLPALKIQTNAPALTPLERFERLLRPEFKVDVLRPPHGDPVFWPACRAMNGECVGIAYLASGLCPRCAQQAYKFGRERGFERKKGDRELLSPELVALYLAEAGAKPHRQTVPTAPTFDLSALTPLLKRQLQYTLQIQRDQVLGGIDHRWLQRFIGRLEKAKVQDIFDMSVISAREIVQRGDMIRRIDLKDWYAGEVRERGMEVPFIRRMLRECAPVMHPMDIEDRDVWRPEDFGFEILRGGMRRNLFFHQQLPWLREATKKYCRYELRVRAVDFGTISARSRHTESFDAYLRTLDAPPMSMSELTRDHLEGFLLWARQNYSPSTNGTRVSAVRHFLDTWREMNWTPKLPETTRLRRTEGGRAGFVPQPQPLDPFVLQQLMSEEFLAQLRSDMRAMLIIGRYHGLRPSSVATLPFDCLRFSDAGEQLPVLHYRNEKKNRDASQPILNQIVVDAIRAQQHRVLAQWPEGSPWLFPHPTGNPDGNLPRTSGSLQSVLDNLNRKSILRDRQGNPATFYWSQLRDTRATEMLNDGVHPTLVASWLDHKDTTTLDHYGKYQAETIRKAIDQAPQLTKDGENVTSAYAEVENRDVETMRLAVKRATNTVMGGLCTLPARDECPHLNRCMTCESFATTPAHLPELLAGLEKSDLLVMAHESAGRARMAEKERQVANDTRGVVQMLHGWIGEHPQDAEPIADWLMTHRAQLERAVKGGAMHDEEE